MTLVWNVTQNWSPHFKFNSYQLVHQLTESYPWVRLDSWLTDMLIFLNQESPTILYLNKFNKQTNKQTKKQTCSVTPVHVYLLTRRWNPSDPELIDHGSDRSWRYHSGLQKRWFQRQVSTPKCSPSGKSPELQRSSFSNLRSPCNWNDDWVVDESSKLL